MSRHLRQGGGRLAAVVLLLSVSCQQQPTAPQPKEPPEKYESLATGWNSHACFGWAETVFAQGWVWKDRDLVTCLAVMGNDEQSARPACLVFARVPVGWVPATSQEMTGDSTLRQLVFQTITQLDSTGPASPTFHYQKKQADNAETFVVGKREFSVAKGRVFLIAVNGATVTVHQIAADLGGLFENPPDFPKLAAEVTALRKSNAQLRRFWAAEDPDAEDSE